MDVSFKDLATELKLSPAELARMRDERLKPDEYFIKDNKRWFTESGAEKMRLAVAIPLAVPKRIRAKVVKFARNPRYVYAKIDGQDSIVPVNIPRKLYGRLLGKPIMVDVIEDANGVSYRHEDLGA